MNTGPRSRRSFSSRRSTARSLPLSSTSCVASTSKEVCIAHLKCEKNFLVFSRHYRNCVQKADRTRDRCDEQQRLKIVRAILVFLSGVPEAAPAEEVALSLPFQPRFSRL